MKKILLTGALLGAFLPFANAQAGETDTFKRKVTVKPGASIVLGESGQASKRCEVFTAPTLNTQKTPTLGKLSSEEYTKIIQPGSKNSLGCEGKPRQMTRVKYTAGRATGTDTLQFSLTNPGRTYIYEITVEVK